VTGLVTYRQLLDEAAGALTGLHTLVSVPNRDPADAAATMVAWRWFVTTAVRHAELLAPHDAVVTSLPRLHPARGTARAVVRTSLHPAGQALMSSCELLGLAHDVLASHLGPERQHRSPEASLIDESGVASPAMRTLSSLLLTAAVAHQELARRAMDVQPAGAKIPDPVARLLAEGVAVLGPAFRIHDRACSTGTSAQDTLGQLAPAVLLSPPMNGTERADQLAGVLARLTVAAHRQSRGELAAGAGSLRALTLIAATLLRHDLTVARAARRPTGELAALAAADRSWASLHGIWNQVATLSSGPRGILQDAVTAMELLDRNDNPYPRRDSKVLAPPGADWSSTTAASLTTLATRLGQEGQILVPTRWCEDVDIPRRWAPAQREHLDWIVDLHRVTERASRHLRSRPSWDPISGAVAAQPTFHSLVHTS
jgi:hypothetical protein